LPVYFTIHSGPASMMGNRLVPIGLGAITIRADQPGDSGFEAAASVYRTIVIGKASQVITFDPIVISAEPLTLGASASSGLPVVFDVVQGPAQITTNALGSTGEGPITIRATQAGDLMYDAAEPVFQTVVISQIAQQIDFEISPIVSSEATSGFAPASLRPLNASTPVTNFGLEASASSRLPVSFAVISGSARIEGNLLVVNEPGEIVVRAMQNGDAVFRPASVERTVVVESPQEQTINFPPLANVPYGAAPLTLTATAGSGLPVQFTVVSGSATLVGNVLTFGPPGVVTIRATQEGNGQFLPAPSVERSFQVLKAPQYINFAAPPDVPFGTASVALNASASSDLPVLFELVSGPAALDGTVLALFGPGTITVRAVQLGNEIFAGALLVEQSFQVLKQPQTIDFPPLPQLLTAGSPVELQASASSGLPVEFSIVSGDASITNNVLYFHAAGTVLLRARQSGNELFAEAQPVDHWLSVKATQTINFPALQDVEFSATSLVISASASSGLPVEFAVVTGQASISGNSLTTSAPGTITLRATQTGNETFAPADSVERTFQVLKVSQNIDFPSLSQRTFGTAPTPLEARASSGLPVAFAVISGRGTITNGLLHVTGAGRIVIRASQDGNEMFSAAAAVDQTLDVAKAKQTLELGPLPDIRFGDSAVLEARASSRLPALFQVVSGPVSIAGNALSTLGAGPVALRIFQPGNDDYLPAQSIMTVFAIRKGLQNITFEAPDSLMLGSTSTPLRATASSGLPVSFTIVSGPAQLVGSSIKTLADGDIIVRAEQPGNDLYEPASVEKTIRVLALPRLSLKMIGHYLTIAWPNDYSGFVFERSTTVNGPWERVEFNPPNDSAASSVEIETSRPAYFFRLGR
jgi:large repetitive protein